MEFHSWALGHVKAGTVVQVDLTGTEATVKLMDASKFSSYKSGQRHKYYYGGHYRQSPIRIPLPSFGPWLVAIDYRGLLEAVTPPSEYSPASRGSEPHSTSKF